MNKFAHINTWLFDLDDTLYAPSKFSKHMFENLHSSLSRHLNMSADEVSVLCKSLSKKYNALPFTGLHRDTDLDMESFIKEGFDLDTSLLKRCPQTKEILENLEGRKVVFTNSPKCHAGKILEVLDYIHIFSDIYDVRAFNFDTKPMVEPYNVVLKGLNVDPEKCVMIEDSYKNLITAKKLGMTTVYVYGTEDVDPNIVDYKYGTLLEFLEDIKV